MPRPSGVKILTLTACILPASAQAAGLWLYEQAAPDMGLATAGRAALATDASTAGANPAGMTRLERNQLEGGLMGIFVTAKFDSDSSTFSGGDGGNAGDFVPAGSFSYVHGITPDLKVGFTAGSYFGLGLDYGKNWAGRYYIQEGELVTMGVNPGVGYKANDWLSLGAGFSMLYGTLDQKVAVNNNPLGIGNDPDGRLELDQDDVGWGYNLGILVEPVKGTRFGLTYRSKIDLDFDDAVSSKNLSPGLSAIIDGVLGPDRKVDLGMTVPQVVMFSAYHQLTDQWAIMGNIGWQDQSDAGKTNISIKGSTSNSITADRNYDDTWHFAVGTQYRFTQKWLLSAGVAYDESPVSTADRTPDMPLDRQWRYATGIQYDLNEDLTIGAAYTFLDAGDAKINQSAADNPLRGELSGDYSSNYIQFFNVNAVYRF